MAAIGVTGVVVVFSVVGDTGDTGDVDDAENVDDADSVDNTDGTADYDNDYRGDDHIQQVSALVHSGALDGMRLESLFDGSDTGQDRSNLVQSFIHPDLKTFGTLSALDDSMLDLLEVR